MLRIYNIPVSLDEKRESLGKIVSKYLGLPKDEIKNAFLFKSSIDARDKNNIHFVYCIDIVTDDETKILKKFSRSKKKIVLVKDNKSYINKYKILKTRPLIIGFGPAGMFAGLTLAEAGQNPIIIERGSDVDKRKEQVYNFWNNRVLNIDSNVQFGEGGAGTFSDGKLNTGINDELCKQVLKEFVEAGAPEEILYLAKPHIGTDNLHGVVKNIRNKIISLGGEIKFETKLIEIISENGKIKSAILLSNGNKYEILVDNLILAIGHSARDTFEMLYKSNISLEGKPFSVGVRIEHLQGIINKSQYGKFYNHQSLGAAEYKLAVHLSNKRGVYTFCMCPGGQVVASSSEKYSVVTNGMSKFARDELNANSAILVNVYPDDFNDSNPLSGIEFQRKLERKAFEIAGRNYNAPVQKVGDFLNGTISKEIGKVMPTYKPGYSLCNFADLFPDFILESLKMGIVEMDKKLRGFSSVDSILTGPETRSSSPVRILRNKKRESLSLSGVYPCGEGAGYAGGIVSAAVDGIKCAESLMLK